MEVHIMQKNDKTEQKYVTQQNKTGKNEHYKHGAIYGIPQEEPYTSLVDDNCHDDLLEMFAEEIFPNEDLGI